MGAGKIKKDMKGIHSVQMPSIVTHPSAFSSNAKHSNPPQCEVLWFRVFWPNFGQLCYTLCQSSSLLFTLPTMVGVKTIGISNKMYFV